MRGMPLYKQYAHKDIIAHLGLSNWGGLYILDFLYGVDDYVVACFDWGTGRQQIRRHKVCWTPSGRNYIWKNHTRYYLDQFFWIPWCYEELV